MSFIEVFSGVFVAQLLVWACQWTIKTYLEPRWNEIHEKTKSKVKEVTAGITAKYAENSIHSKRDIENEESMPKM